MPILSAHMWLVGVLTVALYAPDRGISQSTTRHSAVSNDPDAMPAPARY